MARTPKAAAKTKDDGPRAKAKAARRSATSSPKAVVDPRSAATDPKNKEAIDKVLELCTGHLRQLREPELALEVIRRLRDYYLMHGIKAGSRGLTFG